MREQWQIECKDYYEILQINPAAEPEVIRAAYRRLAAKYTTDNKETGNPRRIRDINEAYEVLADPLRRREYDAAFGIRRSHEASGQAEREIRDAERRATEARRQAEEARRQAEQARHEAEEAKSREEDLRRRSTAASIDQSRRNSRRGLRIATLLLSMALLGWVSYFVLTKQSGTTSARIEPSPGAAGRTSTVTVEKSKSVAIESGAPHWEGALGNQASAVEKIYAQARRAGVGWVVLMKGGPFFDRLIETKIVVWNAAAQAVYEAGQPAGYATFEPGAKVRPLLDEMSQQAGLDGYREDVLYEIWKEIPRTVVIEVQAK